MAKLPAFQFYPADWKKDIKVQSLSFEERGIWFEILCLMHESEERGKLVINKKPMDESTISRLIGCDLPMLEKSLKKILDLGVAYKDKNEIIYNRRMVADEKKRKHHQKEGHKGGNPKLGVNYNKPGYVYAVKRMSDGGVKIGIAKNVKNRFSKLKYVNKKDELELLGNWYVNDMGTEEKKLHDLFENKKIVGEWFKLNELDVQEINFTLKGIEKGNTRASAAIASSSSNTLNKQQVFEFLRCATLPTITDWQIETETEKFLEKYQGSKVGNLRALCNTWANGIRPEFKKMHI